MKISYPLLAAAVVLLIALWGGVAQQSHIHQLDSEIARLEAAADSASDRAGAAAGETSRGARAAHAGREDTSKLAGEVAGFARLVEARMNDKSSRSPDEDAGFRRQLLELLGRLGSLGPDDMIAFLAATREQMDPSEKMREHILNLGGDILAQADPRAALRLAETITGDEQKELRGAALKSLAHTNPADAFAELDRLRALGPDAVDGRLAEEMIRNSAIANPSLAVSRLFELTAERFDGTAMRIATAARSNSERDALISRFAQHLSGSSVEPSGGQIAFFRGIGSTLSTVPPQEAQEWIGSTSLSGGDLRAMTEGVSDHIHNSAQAAAWTEWTATRMSEDDAAATIGSHIKSWANTDSRAALRWIESQPAGPVRRQAESTYLSLLRQYDPEAAKAYAAKTGAK